MRTARVRSRLFFFPFFLPFLAGCAGLALTHADVRFPDAAQALGVVAAEPTAAEKEGLLLRLRLPPGGETASIEENVLYAQIRGGRGLQLKFTLDRLERGAEIRPGVYHLTAVTTLRENKGRLYEEEEITDRGEIVKFLRGEHRSPIGNFRILDWSRSPFFPEARVRPGETWNYGETMSVALQSFWVHETSREPYLLHAATSFEGIAVVDGVRCAVLRTRASQSKTEHLRVLFKQVEMEIRSRIEEVSYFDYTAGEFVAKVTSIQTSSRGVNVPLTDEGMSQSIWHISRKPSRV